VRKSMAKAFDRCVMPVTGSAPARASKGPLTIFMEAESLSRGDESVA